MQHGIWAKHKTFIIYGLQALKKLHNEISRRLPQVRWSMCLGKANTDLPRVNYTWQTWSLSMSHISQALDIAYIDFFKTFSVVSYCLFLKKLMCGLVVCAVGGKLTRHTYRNTSAFQSVNLSQMLSPRDQYWAMNNLFILDGIKCTLMKFANKLNGKVDTSKGRVTL